MKFRMDHSATLLILSSIIISSNGCFQKRLEGFPQAEVKFLGVNDNAVQESSRDAAAIISSWTDNLSTVADLIPFAQALGPILSAVSKLTGLLEKDKSEVDESLGNLAVGIVKAKVVTIRNRVSEAEEDMKKGLSAANSIDIALDKCEEVLELFADESNYLYRGENYLRTSPSLVSFAGVYAGLTGLTFDLNPNRRGHKIKQMKLLKKVVEMYRDAAIPIRLTYFRSFPVHCSEYDCLVFCVDYFSSGWETSCEGEKDLNGYKTQIKRVYTEYFDQVKLENLIQALEVKIKQ